MKEYNTKEFAEAIGCSKHTVGKWRITHRGRPPQLIPARYEGQKAVYTEEQIPLALALLDKKKTTADDVSVSLFDSATADTGSENTEISEENQADRADDIETGGSEEDADEETFKAVIPTDDDDSDDELIDPPEITAAEMKCGELFNQMPKNSGGDRRSENFKLPPAGNFETNESESDNEEEPPQKPKLEVAKEMGFNKNQVAQFQTLADNPAVNKVQSVVDVPTPMIADTPKNFLPMMTAPNFDAIPQLIKGLRRWLCWRLIPAPTKQDPNHKNKPPMTPKNGRLVNADVTNPENWLTYEEALSWYKRGECSGIGFVLTNADPKICCVDVDHCINPDGSLNDEAKAVISLCSNSWTEISQSGSGIHVWFIDEEFYSDRGRKKGNVEVYAFGRYIAMTGNHIQSTAPDLLTVNGACHNVIAKFIDADIDKPSLFDTPARNEDSKYFDVATFDTNAPMNDDDRRLIEYFQSEKCRERDLNMFDLFSGNITQYFKNTGKPIDDSVADEHLMLKILYYVGGSDNDEEIGCRALKIFGQSALAKRSKWEREDYQLRTLSAAFKHWTENGRKSYQSKTTDEDTKPIDLLKAELREVNKDLAAFDTEKFSALETLRNVEAFDRDTVLSNEIITAVAFARAFDTKTFANFKSEVQRYGKIHPDKKLSLNDLTTATKELVEELKTKRADLAARRNQIEAEIKSITFLTSDDVLGGFDYVPDYTISDNGIEKVEGENTVIVCRRPVVIAEKIFDDTQKIYKLRLAFKSEAGKWKKLPAVEAAIIADKNRIINLANYDLPVTSSTSKYLVDYLNAFQAVNSANIPQIRLMKSCGWHEVKGKKIFLDPRRKCVVDDVHIATNEDSQLACALKTTGTLSEWRKAYEIAKTSPVARFMVAAAGAPPLLDICEERNFLLHVFTNTRAGKTTALMLGSSTNGSDKMIRSFDATKNGLAGAAAEFNDYPFLIDEKQVADSHIKEQLGALVYALTNGIGRTKLNRDSSLKNLQDWRTIICSTGETELLDDNITGGGNTRVLNIHAPQVILTPDQCKNIRHIIKKNFGHVLPLVIKEIENDPDRLSEEYQDLVEGLTRKHPDRLPDHCRYIALVTLYDVILNKVLGVDDDQALVDAIQNAEEIFKLVPTIAEIDDTAREENFVRDFIAQNQNSFIGGGAEVKNIRKLYGRLKDDDGYHYLICAVLREACKSAGFDYRKLVADLATSGFFTPDEKNTVRGRGAFVQKKIDKINTRCFRIHCDKLNAGNVN